MKYYAGLDVSMKETFICIFILREDGQKAHESHTHTDSKSIHEALTKSRYELEKIGLENGNLSNYLTKGLRDLGYKAVCIDSHKMAAILSFTV